MNAKEKGMFGPKRPTPKDPWPVEALDERAKTEIWRQETLEQAGIPRLESYKLASCPDVDLHKAVQMKEAGCPPELLVEILV